MNREENRQDSVTLRAMGNTNPDPEADNLADEPEMKALSKIVEWACLVVSGFQFPLGLAAVFAGGGLNQRETVALGRAHSLRRRKNCCEALGLTRTT